VKEVKEKIKSGAAAEGRAREVGEFKESIIDRRRKERRRGPMHIVAQKGYFRGVVTRFSSHIKHAVFRRLKCEQ